MFPFTIFIGGFNQVQNNITKYINLGFEPHDFVTGTIVSVEKISAVNGNFFDCNIRYQVAKKDYFLIGTLSSADHKIVNINDLVKVRFNNKNPGIASIESGDSLLVSFTFILFMLLWCVYSIGFYLRFIILYFRNSKK